MPTVVQFRRGTTAQNDAFTGAVGEISVDTDKNTLRVHDAVEVGGYEVLTANATQTITNKTPNQDWVPAADSAYDLGSPSLKWKDLHLSGNTIYLGDALIHSTGGAVRLPAGSVLGASGTAILDSALARQAFSATDAGGDGSMTYNAGTGVFTYTGPSASETRAHFSGGTGITYNSGTGVLTTTDADIVHDNLSGFVSDEHIAHSGVTLTAGNGLTGGGTIAASRTFTVGAGTGVTVNANDVAIGQDVATTADVTFNSLTTTAGLIVGGNLQVTGTTTTVNSASLEVTDNMIYMNAGESDGSPTQSIDVGWAANVNDGGSYTHVGMFRDATDDRFKVFGAYTPEPDAAVEINTGHASFALADFQAATFHGALSGNATTATTLQTTRTLEISGDATGSTTFNGSANANISVSLAANTVTSSELSGATSLVIYNSAGTALKTLYGAGS